MTPFILKRFFYAIILAAVQILVCNNIHLFGYATPMIYVLFFCYLPLNSSRIGNMFWAFTLGMIIDIFSGTPGQASGAMVITAMAQWMLIHAMVTKDDLEDMVPSYRTLGPKKHVLYLLTLTIVHHTAYFLLEVFSYFNFFDTLLALTSSILLSTAIMLAVDTMRDRKK